MDTEWVSSHSFEVSAVFTSEFQHQASGAYADLAVDEELQAELIGSHVSYAKNAMEDGKFYMNMLPDEILETEVSVDGDLVTIRYKAAVDMVRANEYGREIRTLEELPESHFEFELPADPVDVFARAGARCASDYGNYTLTEYKYYYYFDAEKDGCAIPMIGGSVDVVEIYPTPTVYPEYDRLLDGLADGRVGFRAAILPNLGDNDVMSRFDAHKRELDRMTGLQPEAGDGFVRYDWTVDGASIEIDLFDPTNGYFAGTFHEALGEYQLVFYNGHSNYGHQPFLDKPDAYSDDYQIIGMHSCKSYSYYASQVAAGKATAADPTGFVDSDMIATGRSSYPSDSPYVLVELLEGLMKGVGAVVAERPEDAPSWQDIGEDMSSVAPSILYGIAGARHNTWQPTTQ
jgi:hypothetical protein